MSSTSEDFLIGALIGGAIGVAAALMLTPIRGEALRKRIADGFDLLPNGSTPKRRSMAKAHSRAASMHKPKSEPARNPRQAHPPVKSRRKPSAET